MATNGLYDVVIVGSGYAGANLAYILAALGKKILVIEAGPPFPNSREDYMENFFLNTFKSPSSPYPPNDNAMQPSQTNVPRPTVQALVGAWNDPTQSYFAYTAGSLPFASTYERITGGTGNHWMGTCLRMLDTDMKLLTNYGHGRDWPIQGPDLVENYGSAEYSIGVSADAAEQRLTGTPIPAGYSYPMPALPKSVSDQVIAKAVNGPPLTPEKYNMNTLVTGTPAGRNSVPYQNRRACHGNTNCTPMCPIQAKYDPTYTLGLALDTGNVDIIYKSVVDYITLDSGNLVNGIHYLTYEDISVPARSGQTGSGTAIGATYVLAAHAVENAKILLNSARVLGRNVANSSGQVGCNLMDHPCYLAWGLMPPGTQAFGYRGPIATSGIETLRDGPFRSDRAAWRIEIGNEGWNWPIGDPYITAQDYLYGLNNSQLNPQNQILGNQQYLSQINDLLTRQFRIAFLVEQDAQTSNRVQLSDYTDNLGIPRPLITYNLSDYTRAGFASARQATTEFMSRLGARNYTVNTGSSASFTYGGQTYEYQGAGHLCGTHIMGASSGTSVVNSYQQSWDHPNLYLVGCGSMPSIGTENPTLTMMALVWRTATQMA
jgi:choline dehydrogenase-like flavoprotein